LAKRLTENHLNLGDLALGMMMLAVALAMVSALAGYVAAQHVGQVAFAASALAAVVVWLAGSLSLLVTMRAPDNQAGVTALLMAMLLRIGLPLAMVVLLTQSGSQFGAQSGSQFGAQSGSQVGGSAQMGWAAKLTEAGFFGLVVVHYLAALVIETFFGVRWISQRSSFSQQQCHSLQERTKQKVGSS
jgi:hypothetical protein